MTEGVITGGSASVVLRERTQSTHARVEARVDAPALLRDRAGYRRWLELMLGFHATADPLLERAFPALGASGRAERLRRALRAAGATDAAIAALPAIAPLPAGPGTLYVVEGSALGSAVIAGLARRALGVTAPPESPAERWRAVRALIDGLALEGDRLEAALGEAHATFAAFEDFACR